MKRHCALLSAFRKSNHGPDGHVFFIPSLWIIWRLMHSARRILRSLERIHIWCQAGKDGYWCSGSKKLLSLDLDGMWPDYLVHMNGLVDTSKRPN